MKRATAKSLWWLGVGIAVAATGIALAAAADGESQAVGPLHTVDTVDLQRYLGTWYEIARYPNRFERDCDSNTTAQYSRRNDGRIEVVNSCRKPSGKTKSVRGVAKVVDPITNAKLKVTFFWPFTGNYWVLALGPDYQYAIVGEPSRKYLWVLSRTPQLDRETYRAILDRIKQLGYIPSKLVLTKQPPIR
jgi:apolipoprotein D and lipocalin family protein